jgi:hypothetical protein
LLCGCGNSDDTGTLEKSQNAELVKLLGTHDGLEAIKKLIAEGKMKWSEPDGVRPVLRQAVCDFPQRGAGAEKSQSTNGPNLPKFPLATAAGFETIHINAAIEQMHSHELRIVFRH